LTYKPDVPTLKVRTDSDMPGFRNLKDIVILFGRFAVTVEFPFHRLQMAYINNILLFMNSGNHYWGRSLVMQNDLIHIKYFNLLFKSY
jgi:hypothetical protein